MSGIDAQWGGWIVRSSKLAAGPADQEGELHNVLSFEGPARRNRM